MTALDKLRAIARGWGGEIIMLDDDRDFNRVFSGPCPGDPYPSEFGFYEAPAAHLHGVNTITSTVYIVREHEDPGAVIHEMGHLFADLSITDPFSSIRRHDEWSWLGWEIALARQVDCFRAWSRQNSHYGCGRLDHYQDRFYIEGQDWGALTGVEKELVIKDRIREARRLKLIDRQGRPQRSW